MNACPLRRLPPVLQGAWSALNLTEPAFSSLPGRHLLPDSPAGAYPDLGAVMQASHQLVHLWTVYGMLQAFALVLLIGRLLSTLAFQVRLC